MATARELLTHPRRGAEPFRKKLLGALESRSVIARRRNALEQGNPRVARRDELARHEGKRSACAPTGQSRGGLDLSRVCLADPTYDLDDIGSGELTERKCWHRERTVGSNRSG